MPGCLILAAGSHRRFGSAKLLHPLADGRPLIQHTLDAIQASGLPMALVHRPDDHDLLNAVAHYPLQKIPCRDHESGQGHSIAAGIKATPDWDGWLICLADMPAIQPATYQAIAHALQEHPIVIPEHRDHFGNPRGFRVQFRDELATLSGDQGARDLLLQHRDKTRVLPVADPGILLDVDYPADVQQLAATAQQPNLDSALQNPTNTGNAITMTDTQHKPADETVVADDQAPASARTTEATPETNDNLLPASGLNTTAEAESTPAASAIEQSSVSAAPTEVEADAGLATTAEMAPEENADAGTEPAQEAVTGETAESTAPAAAEEAPAKAAPAQPPIELIRFRELDLDPRLQQGIDDLGFEFATPIQSLALPRTLQGKDVIGKAQTGTGKTAAFLVTVINQLLKEPEQEERYNGEPRALILAPTRELAMQIEKDAVALIKHTPLTMISIVGGMDYQKQQRRLQNEIIDIVVGTPGRLIDFVRSKDLFLSEVEVLVIDEADRMLDMGFIPDVKRLVRETPWREYRQTLMFSATFTQDILNLSGSWTRNAEHLEVESQSAAADTVDQKVYIVTTEEKFTLLYNLIHQQKLERVMIFANRRDETRDLTHKLRDYDIKCAMLSGDVPQQKRIRTLEDFRAGRIRVLIATDVAGRGIHIDDITFVVNYHLPEDAEDYVHRIGRTGRAGKSGTSISFACEEDAFQLPAIEKLLGAKLVCTQPEPELLAEIPPPTISPEKAKERDSHTHRRRRPRRPSGNR
jgi:ATP-dependent RNA helicase RhlB